MIYICDSQGNIRKVFNDSVNLNSNNANEVVLFAPFPNAQVTVAFKLPNGIYTTEDLATPSMSEVDITGLLKDNAGNDYGAWKYLLPNVITSIAGQVQVQFFIYLGNNRKLTTSPVTITVAQGVPSILPQEPSADIYQDILDELAILVNQQESAIQGFQSVDTPDEIDTFANVLTTAKGDIGITDVRIAKTTVDDNGKYLTVDENGNLVWSALPVYNGETEE